MMPECFLLVLISTVIHLTNFAKEKKHIEAEQFLQATEVKVVHTLF